MKEYNIKRHYETHHRERYERFQGEARKEKINELLAGLKKQQNVFTRSREISDAAVKASYLIANKIALASKPYAEGEFVKTCMLTAAEMVCPEKRQAFANISLARNTVADRISELAQDLDCQMAQKVKAFVAFSVAIDESTDITDVAQLAIFIRGVDESLTITEEFLDLVPMTDTTTADDIFSALVCALDKVGVDWTRADVEGLKEDVHAVQQVTSVHEKRITELEAKLNDQERYHRRWNLRLYGVPDEEGEDLRRKWWTSAVPRPDFLDKETRNALWPLIETARKEGKRAFFVGARAYIDGKLIKRIEPSQLTSEEQ
ncbi:hypothetical protein WMY93_007460 [Mugilogobius chulae]|uniref:DUF4371 domain-containing protein n=1 Tax=Mugilogobius chulae TaxID=88201 RepID=A0AAW0PGR4_9GOBI